LRQRIGRTRLPDGTEIAYALAGEGPYLVYVPGWLTHLELSWAVSAQRGFYETLARGRTLVRYDQPGTGLSGPYDRPYTMELERQTLDAVVDAIAAPRFDLFGISLGAPVAADRAARHPSTVDRLVLYGGWVRGADIASPAIQEHVLALVSEHWGLGSGVLADIFLPGGDAAAREMFTRYQRESAPAHTARSMLEMCYRVDVSGVLQRIQAPTLVIHRVRDRAAPLSQGRALAQGIPGARLEVVPGQAHFPYVEDSDAIARLVRRFLGLPALRRPAVASLTPRQYEVAALIADGLTNREIADRLSITERSAESHVERIRDRMGFRSRAQIAAWYATSRTD